MKLLSGDGRTFEVRDCGPVIVRLRARDVPIKFNETRVASDDDAREVLRGLLALGLYEREALS